MDLQEYQQAALRTESKIDKLEFNKEFVIHLLSLFSFSAELLDAIKKAIYYKNTKKMEDDVYVLLAIIEDVARKARTDFQNRYTYDKDITLDPRIFHGIVGVSTEAGELVDVLLRNLIDGKEIDAVNVQEESHGDISWYTAILSDALKIDWNEGLARNIAKLRARYPEKFSTEHAINRDLDTERKILEGNQP